MGLKASGLLKGIAKMLDGKDQRDEKVHCGKVENRVTVL